MFAIKDLDSKDLEIIRANVSRREVDKAEVVYQEGTRGEAMFFVESGSCKSVHRHAHDGSADQIQAIIKPGGFCGEETVLGEGIFYPTTLVALEASVLLELKRESMSRIMASSITTATKLLLGISKNYREALAMPQKAATILAFASSKDGVGQTILASSTARLLARRNKRVLVVDADLQLGDLCLHFGAPPQPSLARLVQMEEKLVYERIEKFFIQKDGISILACPEFPQEAELISRSALNQIVQECARQFDYLVLDLGSHLDDNTLLLWDMADLLFFAVRGRLSDLTRFKRLMNAVSRLNYPREKFHGILNLFDPEEHRDSLTQFQKILPCDWFTIGRDDIGVERAILHGRAVQAESTDSPFWKDLAKMVAHIVGEHEQPTERGGIFSRLKTFFG